MKTTIFKPLSFLGFLIITLILMVSCNHTHEYGDWVIEKKATCTEEGSKIRTCECGESERMAVESSGHDPEWITKDDANCTQYGTKSQICSICQTLIKSDVITPKGHTFGEWNVETLATCSSVGKMVRKCSSCSYEEMSNIPKGNHVFSDGTCNDCGTRDSISTNDVHYVWYDGDNNIIFEEYIEVSQTAKEVSLPTDTEKWDYIEWIEKTPNNFYASRIPKTSYFVGNVFQIIIKDLGETPVATGSAFVFNDKGWFVTNAHVMKDAYYAQAIFNIPNYSTGESFTYLDINFGTYCHLDKDIYIGKIENYSKIKSYYHEISINTTYKIGEATYSVGYPNSSTDLVIADGEITENWSDLYEKLYSGNNYICSSSEIAPGSSGGILTNENLEVIGITTLGWFGDGGDFLNGAAISAFNIKPLLTNTSDSDLISVQERFHKDEKLFIAFFNGAKNSNQTERIEDIPGVIGYKYTWDSEGVTDSNESYISSSYLTIESDFSMFYARDTVWESGDRRTVLFFGYYSPQTGFSEFTYGMSYDFSDGSYYAIYCDDINYSTNISLTLNKYEILRKSQGFIVSESYIQYAKELFNSVYEWLAEQMAKFE